MMPCLRALLASIAVLALGAGACTSPPDLTPIGAWLSCEECEKGERAAVTALGNDAVDALEGALIGPSPAQRANIASQVLQGRRLVDSSTAADSILVERYRANFIATHQQRAAIALGDIGTPKAIRALRRARDEAGARGYRADVLRVIESVLAAGEFGQFHGVVAVDTSSGGGRGRGLGPRNTAGFGDIVLVYRDTADTLRRWGGDETVVLRGGPYPTEVFVDRAGDTLVTFRAIGEPGAYTIELGQLGTNDARSQAAPLRITSARPQLRGPGQGAGGAPTLMPAGLPDTMFITLGSQRADTVDHYRIEPSAAATAVRARVESARALETASVRWLDCAGGVLSMGNVLRGVVVDQQGAALSNAVVRVPALGLGTTATAAGYFSLPFPLTAPETVELDVARIGYRPVRHRIQPGADTVRIGLVSADASEATAIPRFASTDVIAASECRLIQVGIPTGGKRRIVRLIVESP